MAGSNQQPDIIATLLSLDVNFLSYLLIRTRTALLCTNTSIFGFAYPRVLQKVVWNALTKKRNYRGITKSLGVLYRTRSPLVSLARIPLPELNKYLQEAANQGDSKNISALVFFGAQINTQTPSYYTMPVSKPVKEHNRPSASVRNMSALHLASMRGHAQVTEALVACGADLRCVLPDKRTALELAAFEGHTDVVRVLVRGLLRTTRKNIGDKAEADNSCLEGWDEEKIVETVIHLGKLMDLQTRPSMLHALVEDGRLGRTIGNSAELLVWLGSQLDVDTLQKLTPLHYAAKEGFSELVTKYIQLGSNIESKAKQWLTPLHIACFHGRFETAKVLVGLGADCFAKTKSGETPLFLASRAGSVELIRLLIAKGAKVNEPNAIGAMPLQYAAGAGQAEVVRVLMDAGTVMTFNTNSESSPTNIAAFYGHTETVKVLIEKGTGASWSGASGDSPLHSAVYGGHTETVRLLLDAKINVDPPSSTGLTPLGLAAYYGRVDIIDLLVKYGANLNAVSKDEVPPLPQALRRSQNEAAKQLIKLGADVSLAERENELRNRPNLISEPGDMDYELASMLVARGAKVPRGYLYHAVTKNWKGTVKAILEVGIHPDEKCSTDPRDTTPLLQAALLGHKEIVAMLIDKGADINWRDQYDQTPLYHAVTKDKYDVVEILLKSGADINLRTKNQSTALEAALLRENPQLSIILIERGADLSILMRENNTALHLAVRHPSVVRLLLNKGISIDARNKRGETPLDNAHRTRDIMVEMNDPRLPKIDEVISIFAEFNISKSDSTKPQT